MSLPLEIIKNTGGYSCAKYATWFYYRPDHILFDAGEGVSIRLRNMIYGIDNIFISHNHGDHIGGIPGFIKSRASSMGDVTKPLTIYYPQNDFYIEKLRKYLDDTLMQLPFELTWKGLRSGDTVPLNANREMEAFASRHIDNVLTLGYKIVEKRKRLKPEYKELSQKELLAHIKKNGSADINEVYTKNLLVYSGDSMPITLDVVQNAEVLIHDATFIEKEDREELTHATLEEAFELAIKANVSCLGLFHFSSRYTHRQIKDKIKFFIQKYNTSIPIFYMVPPTYSMEFRDLERK